MNVFLSYGTSAAEYANKLSVQLESQGVHLVNASSIPSSADWADTLKTKLADADVVVCLVDPGSEKDSVLGKEWSVVVEQAWEHPSKKLLPVLIRDAKLPSFLQGWESISAKEGGGLMPVVSSLLMRLNLDAEPQPTSANRELNLSRQQKRLEKNSREIAKLELSKDGVEKEALWLNGEIDRLRQQAPASIELANALLSLADKKKLLDHPLSEIGEKIFDAIQILDGHENTERQRARAHMTLGRILELQGMDREALEHISKALELYSKLTGKDSIMTMMLHGRIASLHSKLGDVGGAKDHWSAIISSVVGRGKDVLKKIAAKAGEVDSDDAPPPPKHGG